MLLLVDSETAIKTFLNWFGFLENNKFVFKIAKYNIKSDFEKQFTML